MSDSFLSCNIVTRIMFQANFVIPWVRVGVTAHKEVMNNGLDAISVNDVDVFFFQGNKVT